MQSIYRTFIPNDNETEHIDFVEYNECLAYINDAFSDLDSAMGDVVESLTTFMDACKYLSLDYVPAMFSFTNGFEAAIEWMMAKQIEDFDNEMFEEYLQHVYPFPNSTTGASHSDVIARSKKRYTSHQMCGIISVYKYRCRSDVIIQLQGVQ